MVKLELGLGSRLNSDTLLFAILFCLLSLRVWPWYIDHVPVDGPTPKSVLLTQIELYGIFKKKKKFPSPLSKEAGAEVQSQVEIDVSV